MLVLTSRRFPCTCEISTSLRYPQAQGMEKVYFLALTLMLISCRFPHDYAYAYAYRTSGNQAFRWMGGWGGGGGGCYLVTSFVSLN